MSVFRVKLTNQFGGPIINPALGAQSDARIAGQGNMDEVAQDTGTSIQRKISAPGPNLIFRTLADGDTFTDCNYWKRFAYPQTTVDLAFIEVVTDDGSTYVDGEPSNFPRVYAASVDNGSAYAANTMDILTDNGGPSTATRIEVTGGNDVDMRINGLSTAVMRLASGTTTVFNNGDLSITKLEFAGTYGATSVEVVVAVSVTCNS